MRQSFRAGMTVVQTVLGRVRGVREGRFYAVGEMSVMIPQ